MSLSMDQGIPGQMFVSSAMLIPNLLSPQLKDAHLLYLGFTTSMLRYVCCWEIDVILSCEIAMEIKCRMVGLCKREVVHEADGQVRLLERMHVSQVAKCEI
jgi:hypothetical protein